MQTYTVERTKEYQKWYLNDQPHNEFGPAEIIYYNNGNLKEEHYYLNGEYNRTGGPAAIYYYENGNIEIEEYYLNGKCHRTDGPAIIFYYENGNVKNEYYYLDNKKLTKEEFLSKTQQQSCDGKVVEIDGKKYKLTEL